MDNKNLPAFPFLEYNEIGYGEAVVFYSPDGSKQVIPYKPGLSKREWFAGMALMGICANPQFKEWSDDFVTSLALGNADRVLTALEKEPAKSPAP
jgi:hypothetical protein